MMPMMRALPFLAVAAVLAACADPTSPPLDASRLDAPRTALVGAPSTTIAITSVRATVCRAPGGEVRVAGTATVANRGRNVTEHFTLTAAVQHHDGPGGFAELAGTRQAWTPAALEPGSSASLPFSITFAEPSSGPPYRLALHATITNHPSRPGEPKATPGYAAFGQAPDEACDAAPTNAAPTVEITAPASGAVLADGASVSFAATASDPEDGDLTAAIAWTVDDAPLGATGGSVSTTLAPGTHVVSASVADGGGLLAMDQVTITVQAPAECTNVNSGSVFATTQAEVDALAGVCWIWGQLIITQSAGSPDPITTLAPLSSLARSGGGVRIEGTSLTDLHGLETLILDTPGASIGIRNNPQLTTLAGLATSATARTSGAGFLVVTDNPVLGDIGALANLMDPAGATWGTVDISRNASLPSLAGLERVRQATRLIVDENPLLASAAALSGLTAVSEYVRVLDAPITELDLTSLRHAASITLAKLDRLTTVALALDDLELLQVAENRALQSIAVAIANGEPDVLILLDSALVSLSLELGSGVAGDLTIAAVPALTSLDVHGLRVAGSLRISVTGLTAISTFGTMTSLAGELMISGNRVLTDIDNLSTIQAVGGDVRVRSNTALCVPAWVHAITSGTGVVDIANNGSCP